MALELLLSISTGESRASTSAGDHAFVGELLAHEDGVEGAADGVFGGDVALGARLVGEGWAGGAGGCGRDPEVAVEGLVGELAVECLAGVGAGGREDIDGHLAAAAALQFLLQIEGELGVFRDDGNVGGGLGVGRTDGAEQAAAPPSTRG